MNVMVFDIETIPDVSYGRRVLGLTDLDDEAVANAMISLQFAQNGQSFVKHPFHQIVAISVVLEQDKRIKIWSLGDVDADEAELISRFYAGLQQYTPILVSWNGQQFDLPVLHYRSLKHGIKAPTYWEQGERQSEFKYNNYLNRYHTRHCDLMDVLAGFHQRSCARLDDVSQLLGLPGKMGMQGNHVLDYYLQGKINEIRDYCETDVLNTYLIYLRFQYIRGHLHDYEAMQEKVKQFLKESGKPHWNQYLTEWESLCQK